MSLTQAYIKAFEVNSLGVSTLENETYLDVVYAVKIVRYKRYSKGNVHESSSYVIILLF